MKKILIIEDNTDVRENIGELLELSGYKIVLASTGKEGVQHALVEQPDLIICDIMMPGYDGYSVLRILSKNHQTMDIPFIFLTAKSNREDFRKGMSLGADDYITKPFTDMELIDAVEIRLKKSIRLKSSFDGTAEGLTEFIGIGKKLKSLEDLSISRAIRLYKKKEFLFKNKEYPNQLFFINSGRVKIFRANEYGKELITSIASKGDFLGYLSLIKNGPYQETGQALEDTEISIIPKEDFLELLHGDRDVSSQLIRMLANNISEKEERLLKLAYDSVRKRVADALLTTANKSGISELKPGVFSLRREDLASMTGSTKETVIRTLTDFKEEGLVELKSGKIEIKNWKAISELPN